MKEVDGASLLEHGWSYYNQGKYDLAVKELQESIELLSDTSLAHYRLGFCYRALGKHEDAIQEFRLAEKNRPQDAWYQFQIGKELGLKGQYRKALAEFALSIKKNPRFPDAYHDAGACLATMGYFELSVVCYTVCSFLCELANSQNVYTAVSLDQFMRSTNSLKQILGAKRYGEIQAEVFSKLGMKFYPIVEDAVDLEGFDVLAGEIIPALHSISNANESV